MMKINGLKEQAKVHKPETPAWFGRTQSWVGKVFDSAKGTWESIWNLLGLSFG